MTNNFDNGESTDLISTDEDSIPVLDEVVKAGQEAMTSKPQQTVTPKPTPEKTNQGLNLPDRKSLLTAMRKQLHRQIEKEIQDMAQKIATAAVKKISADLERVIWKELQCSLSDHMDNMLEKDVKLSPDDDD